MNVPAGTAARRCAARSAPRGLALGAALGLLSGCVSPLAIPVALDWNDAQIAWLAYDAGLERAERSGVPILLLIYTPGCEHGPAYSRLFREPDIVAESAGFAMVRVDAERDPEIDRSFMPDGPYVPRTLFLDPTGKPAYALHGADPSYRHFLDTRSADELLLLMRAARRALTRSPSQSDPQPAR